MDVPAVQVGGHLGFDGCGQSACFDHWVTDYTCADTSNRFRTIGGFPPLNFNSTLSPNALIQRIWSCLISQAIFPLSGTPLSGPYPSAEGSISSGKQSWGGVLMAESPPLFKLS